MKKIVLFTLGFVLISILSFSQTDRFWSANNQSRNVITADKAVTRLAYPKDFKLFTVNFEVLKQQAFTAVGEHAQHSTVISLPNADGALEQFEIVEASNFEPALQAKYPNIRAFSGSGITDKYASLKLSISPQGIQAMVFRTDKPNEFMEPYSSDHTIYAVYKSQRDKTKIQWVCSTADNELVSGLNAKIHTPGTNVVGSSAGELRTMRLAQSVTAEYSNYFGAFNASQSGLVLAAVNNTLTRCNGCYEKDLAIHLNLIANTTSVFYYDPNTDPYSPGNIGAGGAWNGQLQSTLTAVIGEANYDIGHLFGASGGGGNAGCIGCVCVNGQKGSGFTSPADGIPMGDNFDIDYVVHEVGHQMGANHTFSFSLEGTGRNKEVGAGITIMGYAGITSYDPAPHSIDIYHETSIEQIQNNMAIKTCPITTNITANNATPVVAPVSNYTIPKSTPFALTGSATDANGDPLTYCWEQNDNATTSGAGSVASPTKATGPNWLSFSPTTSATRLFPKLSTVLAGLFITPPLPGGDPICNIEALSSISRTLNFRLTVRDNHPYSSTTPLAIGQTAYTDMAVTVDATTGPFGVSIPNTNVSWPETTTQTVTWTVNGTDAGTINCANVKISLSIDGGNTFPYVLAATTPNDGTETVTIPAGTTTTSARIKIESIGNIFYDISDANFTIAVPPAGFGFDAAALGATVACSGPTTSSITLTTTSNGGYVTPINLSATGNPAGTTVSFSVNPLVPGNSTVVTINNINTVPAGTYSVLVTGVSGSITQTKTLTFTVSPGAGPAITAQPAAQQLCAGGVATFSVTTGTAISYQWQVSTTGATGPWTNIINGGVYAGATTATLTLNGVTVVMSTNQYRVIVNGQCSNSTSAAAILTINTAPSITTQPAAATTLCQGSNVTYTVAATGTGATYQWQVSTTGAGGPWTNITNGGVYSGATTTSLIITGITAAMDTYQYRAVVTGTCAPAATSASSALTVVTPVSITTQPAATTAICSTGNSNFTVTGSSSATIIYQWQVSTDGGATWTNIANVAPYSGATTATLAITNVPTSLSGYRYRALLSNATCTTPIASTASSLTVNVLPTASITATTTSIQAGQTTVITATTTPTTGLSIAWYKNGVLIPGATSGSYTVDVNKLGVYKVVVTDLATGTCINQSNNLTIDALPSDRLFVYPSPNDGTFTVTYYNTSGTATTQGITIYDRYGRKVYNNVFPVTQAYQLLKVDLRKYSSGIYYVILRDASGKKIKTGEVLIR